LLTLRSLFPLRPSFTLNTLRALCSGVTLWPSRSLNALITLQSLQPLLALQSLRALRAYVSL